MSSRTRARTITPDGQTLAQVVENTAATLSSLNHGNFEVATVEMTAPDTNGKRRQGGPLVASDEEATSVVVNSARIRERVAVLSDLSARIQTPALELLDRKTR